MRKLLLLVFVGLLCAPAALAQFQYSSVFPPDSIKAAQNNGVHGIAVDPDGKVWVQPYDRTDSLFVPETGKFERVTVIYVYNANGTPASFSPIKILPFTGAPADTLGGFMTVNSAGNKVWDYRTGRGMTTDHEGNILASQFNTLYRIDYKTGRGLNKTVIPTGSIAEAAVDEKGNIFVANVVGGNPIRMYDKDFNALGNAVDKVYGFSRSFEVSKDGNKIYWAGYTNHGIILYQRQDEFSAFDSVGVVIPGVDSESLERNDATGFLWVSSGSPNDLPNRWPGVTTTYDAQKWYAFRPSELQANVNPTARGTIALNDPGIGRPRSLAFTQDGNTAYAAMFSVPLQYAVQKFVRTGSTAIEPDPSVLPEVFALEQNYPNPFNPTTEIRFTVKQAGPISLRVFDTLGREVATLVDGPMAAGGYTASFEAGNLASGVYLYVLQGSGQRVARTMVLQK